MKALNAYRDVKRELDKFESPTFNVGDFNYFFNSAIENVVLAKYKMFPLVQKVVDDLRVLVIQTPLTVSNLEAVLPADYRHLLSLKIQLKFTVAKGPYTAGEVIQVYPQRELSGKQGYNAENAYHSPSYKNPYFTTYGSKIQLNVGSGVVLEPVASTNAWLEYLKKPAVVYLNPNPAADLNIEDNNSTIEFPEHIYQEIVRECSRVFLENIESQRYMSATQEKQIQQT